MGPPTDVSETSAEPSNALHITIRFTYSIPDLLLDISNPETAVINLKHLIRSKLDSPTAKHRLRLIHSGKLLKDDDVLSAVLKIPSAPPRDPDPKGKGKAIERPPPRVYINCSVGDALTETELAAEKEAATASSNGKKDRKLGERQSQTTTTNPALRGFDRLLTGGLNQAEVTSLRAQFMAIQESIHTPETMPAPEALRQMEDAWLDNNFENTGGADGGFDFGDNGLGGGAIDDLLWGNIMGFLWPLGCVGWAIHQEGIWSARRKVAVFTGFILSLSFGMLRVVS